MIRCKHPNCDLPVRLSKGDSPCKYCEEHSKEKWGRWRWKQKPTSKAIIAAQNKRKWEKDKAKKPPRPCSDCPLPARRKKKRCAACQRKYINKIAREWKIRNPLGYLAAKARRYGLTLEQYQAIEASQNGLCGICLCPPTPDFLWCIDHDHECCPTRVSCGKCVRGLLCQKCNSALSIFRNKPIILRAAADYIERYEERKQQCVFWTQLGTNLESLTQ